MTLRYQIMFLLAGICEGSAHHSLECRVPQKLISLVLSFNEKLFQVNPSENEYGLWVILNERKFIKMPRGTSNNLVGY